MWTHFPEEHIEGIQRPRVHHHSQRFLQRNHCGYTGQSERQGLMPQPKTTCRALPSLKIRGVNSHKMIFT